jgi:anti-sigma factor RsiW
LFVIMPPNPRDLAPPSEAAAEGQSHSVLPAHTRGLTCNEAVRRLWDYVDARLPDTPRAEVDAHLAVCATCAGHVAFARAMQRALAETAALATPDERHAALRARVLTTMNDARS